MTTSINIDNNNKKNKIYVFALSSNTPLKIKLTDVLFLER